VFALRMSNDRDQQIVTSAVSDTGSGLLEFLPALGQREAIAFGDGVTLPVRIKFDELPKSALPRSSTARFSEKWQHSNDDESLLEQIVERWRASGSLGDMGFATSMFAESLAIPGEEAALPPAEPQPAPRAREPGEAGRMAASPAPQPAAAQPALQPRSPAPLVRREATPAAATAAAPAARPAGSLLRREATAAPASPAPASPAAAASPLRSLRDRLMAKT
jgi:hypothetical protein